MKNWPAPECCSTAPKIGEQDDQARGDVDRGAEDPLQRHVEVGDEVLERVAAVRPRRRQVVAEDRVEQEHDRDAGHDAAGGAPRALQQQDDEDDADQVVGRGRHGGAIAEIGALREHVEDGAGARRRRADSPTSECGRGTGAPSGTGGSRAPAPCRHGPAAGRGPGRSRRPHRGGRTRRTTAIAVIADADPAAQAVERAFFLLDVALDLLARVERQGAGGARRRQSAIEGLGSTRRPRASSTVQDVDVTSTLMPFSLKYFSAPGCHGNAGAVRGLPFRLDVERLLVHQREVVPLLQHGLGELVGEIVGHAGVHRHDVPDGVVLGVLVHALVGGGGIVASA